MSLAKDSEAAPVIYDRPFVDTYYWQINVFWHNTNPAIDYFRVCVSPEAFSAHASSYSSLANVHADVFPQDTGMANVDSEMHSFSCIVSLPYAQQRNDSYLVTVQGITYDGKIYTSDAWYCMKTDYGYTYRLIQLDR